MINNCPETLISGYYWGCASICATLQALIGVPDSCTDQLQVVYITFVSRALRHHLQPALLPNPDVELSPPTSTTTTTTTMTSLLSILTIYLLGGLTFLPLLLASAFLYAYLTFPEVPPSTLAPDQLRRPEDADDTDTWKTTDEKLVRRLANSVDVAAGYFLVTREFVPGGVNGKPPERASPVGSGASQTADSPSVYQSMYRSLFERKSTIGAVDSAVAAKARAKRARNEFFVVLRCAFCDPVCLGELLMPTDMGI